MLYVLFLQFLWNYTIKVQKLDNEIVQRKPMPWETLNLPEVDSAVGIFLNVTPTPSALPTTIYSVFDPSEPLSNSSYHSLRTIVENDVIAPLRTSEYSHYFYYRNASTGEILLGGRIPIFPVGGGFASSGSDGAGSGCGSDSSPFSFVNSSELDLFLLDLAVVAQMNFSFPLLGALVITDYQYSENPSDSELGVQSISYVLQYDFPDPELGNGIQTQFFKVSTDAVSTYCLGIQILLNTRSCDTFVGLGMMNEINSLIVKKNTGRSVTTRMQQMPFHAEPFKMDLNLQLIFGGYFFPLFLHLMLPVFMYKIVREKRVKVKEMMLLMGMRYRNYVCSNVVTMMIFAGASVLCFCFVGSLGFRYRFITQTNPGLLVVLFIGCNWTVVALAHFLSAFFRDEMMAALAGYFVVLVFPILCLELDYNVLSDGGFWAWKFVLLIETFPITDSVYRLFEKCQQLQCEKSFAALWQDHNLLISILLLYVWGLVVFLAGLYLDHVIPPEWGRRRNVCCCVEDLFCLRKRKKKSFKRKKMNCCRWLTNGCRNRCRKSVREEEEEDDLIEEDEDVRRMREQILSGVIHEDSKTVLVKGLVKEFGELVAVNDVNFYVKSNEIFALLGPNGAGKTTLIRCLVGLYDQNDGDAFIAGQAISTAMDRIRSRSISFCPQFDIFWDDLTPRETLLFFARLRGVSPLEEWNHVNRIMEDVGLLGGTKAVGKCRSVTERVISLDRVVSRLSMGYKRRLAIGIALCGDPPLLILDEPTTGLDPTTKRAIWETIFEQKRRQRSVIITTHSMEEADVLADTIGIMSRGRLVCFGSSLDLKQRHGGGYVLQVNYSRERREDVLGFVENLLLNYESRMIKEFGTSLTWVVKAKCPSPMVGAEEEGEKEEDASAEVSVSSGKTESSGRIKSRMHVSTLFDELQKTGEEAGIQTFQLNQTTLEDVFLRVVARAEKKEVEEEMKRSKIDVVDQTQTQQQVLSSIDDGILPHLQSEAEEVKVEDEAEPEGVDPEIRRLLETNRSISSSSSKSSLCCCPCCVSLLLQSWGLFKKSGRQLYRRYIETIAICLSPLVSIGLIFILALMTVGDDAIPHPLVVHDDPSSFSRCFPWAGHDCYTVTYSTEGVAFGDDIMTYLVDRYSLGAHEVRSFDDCQSMKVWIGAHPNQTAMGICFKQNGDNLGPTADVNYELYFNGSTTATFNVGDNTNHARFWKTAIDNAIIYLSTGGNSSETVIKSAFKPYPRPRSVNNDGQGKVLAGDGPTLFSLTTMLLMIVALAKLVEEKENGLKRALLVMGMNRIPYFLSWLLVFTFYAAAMAVVIIIGGFILQLHPFFYANLVILFLLFFTYNMSVVAMAFFLSSFLSSVRSALNVGFGILGICCILNNVMANGDIISVFMNEGAPRNIPLMFQIFYPSWNFAMMCTDIFHQTSPSYSFAEHKWMKPTGFGFKEFGRNETRAFSYGWAFRLPPPYYSFLYLLSNIALFLFLYLVAEITPLLYHWLVSLLFSCFVRKRRSYDGRSVEKSDVDVRSEYFRVSRSLQKNGQHELSIDEDEEDLHAVDVFEVKKTFYDGLPFSAPTHAVRQSTFCLDRRCCVTILGNNGAGKTTLLRCITGDIHLSGGDIVVYGHSVNDSIRQVRQSIGVCFQEDVVLADLTAAETLRFFGEIKGLPRRRLTADIESQLRAVNLWSVRNVLVRTFSGGMKRRLSVAAACIASPSVLLLDEPTTGLDPFSKREVWRLIFDLKQSKSVLMTTHSFVCFLRTHLSIRMEEADALSDRIGILSNGVLRCIGDSLQLKLKSGSCYVLRLLPNQKNRADADPDDDLFHHVEPELDVVSRLRHLLITEWGLPLSSVTEHEGGAFVIRFYPNEYDSLSRILYLLEEILDTATTKSGSSEESLIKAFGLTHTSLEDVLRAVSSETTAFAMVEEEDVGEEPEEGVPLLINEGSTLRY